MCFKKTTFFLPLILFSVVLSNAQTAPLKIEQNSKLDTLLQLKMSWDKETFENSYYTIQLHYGGIQIAKEIQERFQKKFPHIPTDLSFETPNYKVQSGEYKNELFAIKTLDSIKPYFPSAFLLKRKRAL